MTPGQIVFSKKGRDAGSAMIVLAAQGEYAYLADGKRRTIAKPKKKKAKHIQITNVVVDLVPPCGRVLQDADIRKHLAQYVNQDNRKGR